MQQEVQTNAQQSANLARLQQARFGAKQTKSQPSQHAARFSNRLQNLQPTFTASQTKQATDEEYDQEGQDEDSQKNFATRWSMLQASTALAKITQKDEEEKQEQEQKKGEEKNRKKQNEDRTAMHQGFMTVANSIAGALDSTVVGFLIGFFVHLGTVCSNLLKTIYGSHIAGGKSKYVPPRSWGMIPLKGIDPKATILQVFDVVAAIALATAIIILGAGGLCFIHDYVQFLSSPIQTAANAASGAEGMCLGGIIPLLFGP